MTCHQQQAWKITINNDYLTAYSPEQILAVQDYITQRLASNHLSRNSKEKLFTMLLARAKRGQQLTDMVLEANTKIQDLKAQQNKWLPMLITHKRIFSQDELIVIAKANKTAFHSQLWGIIHQRKIREQNKPKNWDLHNQMRQLIQILGEKPDYEFVKLGIEYKTRTLFHKATRQQQNKIQHKIQNKIQYIVA